MFINLFSIQKIQRGRIFNELTQSLRVYFFLNKYREVFINLFSIQKIQRGKIFLLELTQSLRVYLLFLNNYREVVLLLRFSIQKFKEAEFFYSNWHSRFEFICFFANISEKCFYCSRYKKFKETEFFNEQTGLVKERTD